MSKFTALTDDIHGYLVEHGARQDGALRRVEEQTAAMGDIAVMQVAPDQGALITLLVRAVAAQEALELGTFTGYSAICIARGLASGGRLISCELSEDYAALAARNLEAAGLASRVEIRIGPALETVRALPEREVFDFAFIDADKPNYTRYWEEVVRRLRPGGLAMVDNVLAGGRAVTGEGGEGFSQDSVDAIRRTNELIRDDDRVEIAMLGIADGVTLALKRSERAALQGEGVAGKVDAGPRAKAINSERAARQGEGVAGKVDAGPRAKAINSEREAL